MIQYHLVHFVHIFRITKHSNPYTNIHNSIPFLDPSVRTKTNGTRSILHLELMSHLGNLGYRHFKLEAKGHRMMFFVPKLYFLSLQEVTGFFVTKF